MIMRVAVLLAVMLAVPGIAARAEENQAFLGIFIDTRVMKMAGMPEIPNLPNIPEGVKLPGAAAGMMMMGRPQRKLDVRLWSPGLAPQGATAALAVPEGLKLGPKLDLELYRPSPEEGKAEGDYAAPPEFIIKRYWGSSPTVKEGQPEVTRFGDLTPEQKAAMREQARKNQNSGSYFYKPDWTTGHWPTGKQPGVVAKEAALPGTYALTTSYTGNVSIDVPEKVDFLAPIEMSSPRLDKSVGMEQAITFQWKPVPGVLGYYASIVGMQGKNTMILWSSSEIKTDVGMGWDYLQMSEVAAFVKSTAMMAPDRVQVVVPAGIFKDCDMVFFTMVGYGPGTALDKAQPLPRVQTKTTLQIMLGGKAMKVDLGDRGILTNGDE